jgi:hypothetical protein
MKTLPAWTLRFPTSRTWGSVSAATALVHGRNLHRAMGTIREYAMSLWRALVRVLSRSGAKIYGTSCSGKDRSAPPYFSLQSCRYRSRPRCRIAGGARHRRAMGTGTPRACCGASGLRKRSAQCVSLWCITLPSQIETLRASSAKECRQLTLSPLEIQFLMPESDLDVQDLLAASLLADRTKVAYERYTENIRATGRRLC